MGLFFNASGVRGAIWDGAWNATANVAAATGAYHLAQMKWDGANLKVRVDSGAWDSVACGNIGNVTGTPLVGVNYTTAFLDGRILDIITADTALADGTFDSLVDYVNDRYSLAL